MSRREERKELEILEDIEDTLVTIADALARVVQILTLNQATTAVVSLGGPMPLEVGGTTTATTTFVTAVGGSEAAPPKGDGSGITVTYSIDNTAVATVGAASAGTDPDTAVGTVTGVSAGDYNLTTLVANTSGATLFDDDGVTEFVQPAVVAETVTAPPPAQATTAVTTIA